MPIVSESKPFEIAPASECNGRLADRLGEKGFQIQVFGPFAERLRSTVLSRGDPYMRIQNHGCDLVEGQKLKRPYRGTLPYSFVPLKNSCKLSYLLISCSLPGQRNAHRLSAEHNFLEKLDRGKEIILYNTKAVNNEKESETLEKLFRYWMEIVEEEHQPEPL